MMNKIRAGRASLRQIAVACAMLSVAPTLLAADLTMSITNLTRGTWMTPFMVAAHPASFKSFADGAAASVEIQGVGEAGNTAGVVALLPAGSSTVLNPNSGALKPGGRTTTVSFTGGANTPNIQLTILAMLVPTNDGFMALNAIDIPTAPGTYNVNADDAGTEANDEMRAAAGGINRPGMIFPGFLNDANGRLSADINPAAPGFVSATKEGFVHIHRGMIGSAPGGVIALDNTVYRWSNPVACVVLRSSKENRMHCSTRLQRMQ